MRALRSLTPLQRLAALLAVVIVAVLAAAAAGLALTGDDDDASPAAAHATPAFSPSARATASTEPSETSSPAPSPTPAASPTPGAPTPGPASGPSTITGPSAVTGLSLPAASVTSGSPVEIRDTVMTSAGEQFQDPSHPSRIAYYQRYGVPGSAGTNALFAAHINYVNYGNGPFAHLTSVSAGSSLSVTLASGETLDYTVSSVRVVPLDQLDMDEVVFPALSPGTERVTLISCGGTFVPNASGSGGEYNSRVILTADRTVS